MRLLLAVVVVLLAGCTNRAETVAAATPRPAVHEDTEVSSPGRGGPSGPTREFVAPVYPDARPLVFLACQRAALTYFGHIDEQDEAGGRLAITDRNAWFGNSDVVVRLSTAAGGTRVNVSVTHGIELLRSREATVLDRYLARLEIEIATVRGLRAAIADQTPTAAGTAGGSSTSRP